MDARQKYKTDIDELVIFETVPIQSFFKMLYYYPEYSRVCRFCPSVFLYLTSVVPAIWLLELDKVDRRLRVREEFNLTGTTGANLKEINNLIGVSLK